MKIYFIGSHSVGKTTLARHISKIYGLPLLNEIARTILCEQELQIDSLRSNLSAVNAYQKEVLFRQIDEEKKHNNFVSDRSFDCLAYTAQHATILSELIHNQDINNYIKSFKDNKSLIFFIRPSKITLKNDGIRESVNWDNIVAIDAMIKFMIEFWDIPCIHVGVENLQERIKTITAVINIAKLSILPS